MWFLDCVFYLIGVAVISAAAGIVLAVIVVGLWMLRPRLHIGRPKYSGELSFYERRADGSFRTINAPLGIRWWLGLSKRNSARWFIGVIRWEPKE
ncbi:hypothetical protein AB7M49_007002 [Bradyrhizobium elkanii]